MKNAKRILLFALALVALTLVMSLSIFAEEATEPVACAHPVDAYDWNIVGCSECGTLAVLDEGSTNVSSNLGYKILYASKLDDVNNKDYDVIRLTKNYPLPSNSILYIDNENAIIDLGGNVLYRNGGYLRLRITNAKGFVNGYVYKTNGGLQVMAVTRLGFLEDVTLVGNGTKSNNITGLIMNTDGAYLGSMKNVTICAGVLNDYDTTEFDFVNVGTNGIYNHGIEATKGSIGSMENVKISTYGQAITSAAKIGTMTNCVFSADNIALNITTLQSEMKFVNCEIHSKNLAIYIANAVESTEEAPVSFDIGDTKFVTNGAVYDISSHIIENEMFAALTSAKALVNGRLYTSLADAVSALVASTEEVTTFALIADLAVDATIVIDKKVNFSFGGASYDVPVYGTNQVTHKTVTGYTVTSSVDVVFSVVEGGDLTISGDGRLEGTENAIVADGGVVVITAGTYVGYNPREFVSAESCVVNNEGVYTIAAEHDYDDDVGADKTNYQVDGVCNNCGFVRGIYAVDNIYYMTLEEAFAAALENGKQIVLAADIVLENDTVWDLTGVTFNFNNLTVTGNLSIVGGTFTTDVTEYLADGYCSKYVAKQGYVVSVHEFVAGAPAADGSITYTCAGCDESYVTNNSAINGTYYDSAMNAYVFADGVLSAMGNTCNYTYNVTSGMIETDAGIFFQVVDGVICIRGAQPLHQHTGEGYIAEAQADGSINYVCPSCGTVMYTINNSAINGEYFLPGNFKTFFTFKDGILIIEDENPMMMPSGMAGRYMYTYNVTTGEITLDPASLTMYVENGVIYAVGRMPMPLSVVVPPMELEIGSTVIDVADSWEGTTVVVSVAGTYILYAPEGTAPYIMVEDAYGASAIEQYPYEFTVADGQVFKFIVLEPTTLTLAEKPAHVHTEVEIPMVLPTPSKTGYTAGIMCSDCGETIKAPVAINVTEMANTKDPNFRVASATLTLSDNIAVQYSCEVKAGYNNAYMVFVFRGQEYIVTEYSINSSNGRFQFKCKETRPHYMSDNIAAYVYAETSEGEYSVNCVLEYSIMQYCITQLKKNDATLTTVVSDVLTLGAQTQIKEKENTNALVTDLVKALGYELTPTAFTSVDEQYKIESKNVVTGDRSTGTDWKSASLVLGSATQLQYGFVTDNIEGLVVKVKVGNSEAKEFTAANFKYDTTSNRYYLALDYITVLEFGTMVTATFERDGVQVGSTIAYSINAYLYSNCEKTSHSEADRNLMKALYVYGTTIAEFSKNQ